MVNSQASSETVQGQMVNLEPRKGIHAASRQASAGRRGGSKMNPESRKIKKVPQPLQVQSRRPVIIHTHSPKAIRTDSNNFMWLVQRLTGSSDTRSRCERNKPSLLNHNDNFAERPSQSMHPLYYLAKSSDFTSLSDVCSNLEAFSLCPGSEADVSYCHTSKVTNTNHKATDDSASSIDLDGGHKGAMTEPLDNFHATLETQALVSSLPSPNIFSAIFLHELPALSPTAHSCLDLVDSSAVHDFRSQRCSLDHCQAC
ncbi:hypothetical protein O6H91_02G034100 [Diphasiastrum complanatum]|uniref:Uncharacterized protein n=1 Tax=Diphasiastrum complanatum TaxID=34168 RepID=A0ACC2EED1_DIPCM|nr:hypothetical protein O6H91_02G034100 [Diphasiastrum complanatum]